VVCHLANGVKYNSSSQNLQEGDSADVHQAHNAKVVHSSPNKLYLSNIVWLGNLYCIGDLLLEGHEMAVPTGLGFATRNYLGAQ
jgi:hypothetical protein